MEQKKMISISMAVLLPAVVLASVLGPEQIAQYKDKATLNQIIVEESDSANEGYRYTLSSNEKLFLLSKCLKHQALQENELSAGPGAESSDVDYGELMGAYAFVMNRQGPSGREITAEEIFQICNQEINILRGRGVLPDKVREVEPASYSAVLYSAIDVLEPQNNMPVWKVSLSTSQQNADKTNRLIDAYIDAVTGRIYGFYVRTESVWSEIEPKKMVELWSDYLGLTGLTDYDSSNPLLETTPDFEKYCFPGTEEGNIIVTVGFYEGINELFLKII